LPAPSLRILPFPRPKHYVPENQFKQEEGLGVGD